MNYLEDKLIPFNNDNKHSISEAIFSIFLPNKIFEPNRYKVLILEGGELSDTFQNFRILKEIEVALDLNENEVKTSKYTAHEEGFQFEAYRNAKLEWLIRYQPTKSPNQVLSIHCMNYKAWDNFYQMVFKFLSIISKIDKSIYVSGHSLNYIDQFDWLDSSNPPIEKIFNTESKYLAPVICDSKDDWSFISNFDSELASFSIKQHINVGSRKIATNRYNLYLIHIASMLLPEPKSLESLCIEENQMKDFYNKLHLLNKVFLKETLKEEVLDLIGIK